MRPDVRVAPGSRIFSPPAKAGVARPGYESFVSRRSAVKASEPEPTRAGTHMWTAPGLQERQQRADRSLAIICPVCCRGRT